MTTSIFHRQALLLVTAVGFCVAALLPQSVQAIGVSPHKLDIDSALNNVSQTKTFKIVRAPSDPRGNTDYLITPRGADAQFVQVSKERVTLRAGENTAEFQVIVSPSNSANGSYSAAVDITPAGVGPSDEHGTVSVVTGATLLIGWSIDGKEKADLEVRGANLGISEVSDELPFTFVVENTGNVVSRVDTVILEFTDVLDPSIVYRIELDGTEYDFEYLDPGQIKELLLALQHQLPVGEYTVDIDFFFQGELIKELSISNLKIVADGTLLQDAIVQSLTTNKTEYAVAEVVKAEAIVENTGEGAVSGEVIFELHKDEALLDFVKGDTITLAENRTAITSHNFKLEEAGAYTVGAYFEYNGQQTPAVTTDIQVVDTALFGETSAAYRVVIWGLIGLFGLATLGLFFWMLFGRKREACCEVDDLECWKAGYDNALRLQEQDPAAVAKARTTASQKKRNCCDIADVACWKQGYERALRISEADRIITPSVDKQI